MKWKGRRKNLIAFNRLDHDKISRYEASSFNVSFNCIPAAGGRAGHQRRNPGLRGLGESSVQKQIASLRPGRSLPLGGSIVQETLVDQQRRRATTSSRPWPRALPLCGATVRVRGKGMTRRNVPRGLRQTGTFRGVDRASSHQCFQRSLMC